MGTFNDNDGFTTGFLGEKKKNTISNAKLEEAIFGSQSLNISDTQRIRTFNSQSNDPDSLTFNSNNKSRTFNNASNFDNSFSNQFQGNNSQFNNISQGMNNNQQPVGFSQGFNNNQQMNFTNMNQNQMMNPNNMNMVNSQPTGFDNSQVFSNTQQMNFTNMNQNQMMNPNGMNMGNSQPTGFDNSQVFSNTQQMNFNNMSMNNTQQMNFGNQVFNDTPPVQPVTPVEMPKLAEPVNMSIPPVTSDRPNNPEAGNIQLPNPAATGAQVSTSKKVNVTKILNISSIVVLSLLIIFVVLYSTGVISFKKTPKVDTNQEEVINPEEEKIERMVSKLNVACNNLDAEGNYGSEPELADDTCNVITCYIVNNAICANGLCMISDGDTVYSKVCSTGNLKKVNANDFQANVNLGELCTVINNNDKLNGNLSASYGTCVDYRCETVVAGKSYSATCQKNS